MKELYCSLLILLFSFTCVSQNKPDKFREKSWQTFAFRVTATEAELFIKWDSIPVDNFVEREPAMVFNSNFFDEDELPVGNYVLLSAVGIYIKAQFVCVSNLVALNINNKQRLQLDIRDKEGRFITGAKVFINNRPANYNKDSKTFWATQKKLNDALVKVYTPSDTLYLTLTEKDDYRINSIGKQRVLNYRSTKIYHWLNWLPAKVKRLFTKRYYKSNSINASGYIIFNQPKYKPLDTVKYKGYVVNKRGMQYNKNVNVHLTYNSKGNNFKQLIGISSPVSPGAFVGQFVLADTIPMDETCRLIFKTSDDKVIIQNYFKTEDYVLDEVSSYQLKSDKEIYFKNDSLRFFASAKDANGLNVLDAKATLLLTTHIIHKFYQDTLFVQDTIYQKEISLSTNGDIKFTIAAADLPKADVTIKATLIFKNSNNELHEETNTIEYKYLSKDIDVIQNGDSLKVVYIEDGIEKSIAGEFAWNEETERPVHFPAMIKIDPVAKDYSFYVNDKNGKTIVTQSFDIKADYRLALSRISNGDTLGFALNNPYKIPVYFTVFDGKTIVATGKQSDGVIVWKKVMNKERQTYKVRWQYIWAGEERQGEETIGLLYKMLHIQISTNNSVYPGQKDSISIDVKDYKGRPAADVNLTAVSYNNQFNKDIRVQEPPYLVKYKSKKYLLRQGYENEGNDFTIYKNYLLGKNKNWINKFHLDTMSYYKLLFPKENYYDAVSVINNFVPQLSVNMVQQGVPQEIYLLFINRQLVYYNGVTDRMKYAFQVYPGNVQIGIRLKDKYIEIDSLYIQPNYKHDLSFDLDNLPANSKVASREKYWSYQEMSLLEQAIWQMQDNKENNHAYLWQGDRVVRLSSNREHTAGPFTQNEMTFFSPQNFNINFKFEPGYQYSLSKQVLRLEKKLLFARKDLQNALPQIKNASLQLGDTMIAPPEIVYQPVQQPIYLQYNNEYEHKEYASPQPGKGTLQFTRSKDCVFLYYILEPANALNERIIVADNYNSRIKNILPGTYSLLMVTNNYFTAQIDKIVINESGTTCIQGESLLLFKDNALLNKIVADNYKPVETIHVIKVPEPEKIYMASDEILTAPINGATVTGTIVDKKGGNPVPGVLVVFKGYRKGASSDALGNFTFNNLRAGSYKLVISTVGYEQKEIDIYATSGETIRLKIQINASVNHLEEVVVTGYGTMKKKDITGSIMSFNGASLYPEQALQGRLAGLATNDVTGNPGEGTKIFIRGISSLINNKPLYVIDGIIYDDMPNNLDESSIKEISVLKDAAATSVYGARGANGVIVITTQTKTFRTTLKDYALWQPNFFTDKNGHAAIEINYPDNITGWKTYVVAMDKKRRMGKAYSFTQAYKPMVAELSVPQFLIEGDSAALIGKSKNYTTDKYNLVTTFSVDGNTLSSAEKQLLPNAASIESATISTKKVDTVTASYTLHSSTGFNDGEERKIPVLKKGTDEAIGNFWILQNDTTVTFTALPNISQLNIYAQNNTLDLMLEELEHLRKYPYYCMEQTASKLTGLALEKKIKLQLNQPFNNQKEFDKLLQKIHKAQLFDGGWAWWENGKTNFYITNYITNALLQFRENLLIESNIRNAFLYLQNQLPGLKTNELLAALFTLSNGKHEMNYAQWINKINYDSLTQHQQWQWVSIKQQQQMNYQQELKKLADKKTGAMTGGVHWGTENNSWYSNDIATTVLAYKVMEREPLYSNLCNSIVQYFLEKRHHGYWNNTVESATILNAILPKILSQQSNFKSPAVVSIKGDTSFVINSFPYQLKSSSDRIKILNIQKTGVGMVYLTAYQHYFNIQSKTVEDKFIIHTYFSRNNENSTNIKAGEKVKMIVSVNVLKDAEYVQIEIPIPAGCNYASKNNNDWKVYKEFYKNKVLLFTESLSNGEHQFEIELEPRYSGIYTLNPAKALLMYYPIFYGRNEMKKVTIVN